MKAFRRVRGYILLSVCLGAFSAVAADKYKIVNEGGIREDWAAADGAKFVAPGYPGEFAARGDDVCLAMGYAILADGTTGDFAIVKAWSSSADGEAEPVAGFWKSFAQASAGALSQWKFKPRAGGEGVPTYTVATLTFQGKGAVSAQSLRANCAIGDLKAAIMDKKADRFMNSMDKHEMERQSRNAQQAAMRAAAAKAAGWSNNGN